MDILNEIKESGFRSFVESKYQDYIKRLGGAFVPKSETERIRSNFDELYTSCEKAVSDVLEIASICPIIEKNGTLRVDADETLNEVNACSFVRVDSKKLSQLYDAFIRFKKHYTAFQDEIESIGLPRLCGNKEEVGYTVLNSANGDVRLTDLMRIIADEEGAISNPDNFFEIFREQFEIE